MVKPRRAGEREGKNGWKGPPGDRGGDPVARWATGKVQGRCHAAREARDGGVGCKDPAGCRGDRAEARVREVAAQNAAEAGTGDR